MAADILREGGAIPFLLKDKRVNAEIYKINNSKILVRHSDSQWEWIDRKSPRLFPVLFLRHFPNTLPLTAFHSEIDR